MGIEDLPKPVSRCCCTVYHETDSIPLVCEDCGRKPIPLDDAEVKRLVKTTADYLMQLRNQRKEKKK